jgi:hypothetical protein
MRPSALLTAVQLAMLACHENPAPAPHPVKFGASCTDGGLCAEGLLCLDHRDIAGTVVLKTCELACDAERNCPAGLACARFPHGPLPADGSGICIRE